MKVLIIGLGAIGQRHVRNLRTLLGGSVEILAYRVRRLSHVVTPTLQSDASRNVEQEYGVRAFSSLESAVAERPQVAFLCNPSSLHVAPALECVRAGCDLFIEKPVSNNLEGLAELRDEVARRGRVVMVGYQLRFHPGILALQEVVREGRIGQPLAVRAIVGEYLPGWHPYEDYRRMYASRADLGGGVIVTQIHELDYLFSLFGLPRRIFALGGHWSRLEIDVEDVASMLMEFQVNGRVLPVHLQQDYLQRPPSRNCEILGDCGRVVMDLTSPSLTIYDQDGQLTDSRKWESFDRNQMFLDELRHFLECVETRRKPVVDLNDGVRSLQLVLAARESIATGKLIEISEVLENARLA